MVRFPRAPRAWQGSAERPAPRACRLFRVGVEARLLWIAPSARYLSSRRVGGLRACEFGAQKGLGGRAECTAVHESCMPYLGGTGVALHSIMWRQKIAKSLTRDARQCRGPRAPLPGLQASARGPRAPKASIWTQPSPRATLGPSWRQFCMSMDSDPGPEFTKPLNPA